MPVSHGTEREAMSFLFVRIETDDGLVGYGEACDSYGCSYASVVATIVEQVYAPLLIGQSPHGPAAIASRLVLNTRRRLGHGWAAAHARSAIELALWDVVGKIGALSASRLVGRHRDRVELYGSLGFLEEHDAAGHLAAITPLLTRGVTKIKTRIGPEWRQDLFTLRELRGLLRHDVEIMVDGSEIFTLPSALTIASELATIGVVWFEEPLPQSARSGIADLARRSAVPIAYGEHLFGLGDAAAALANGEVHVLQPDASTCGGLSEARSMAALAAVHGVRVVPHVCAGPVSLAANLHLAASVPGIRLVEYPPVLIPVWNRFAPASMFGLEAIADGTIAIPDGPGLGVNLDETAIAAHPYQPPGTRVSGTVGGLPDRFTGDR